MTTPYTTKAETPAKQAEEFEVLLVSDDLEPGYAVFCPSLPGCNSQGDDWDEALAMITEAIAGFLEFAGRPAIEGNEMDRMIRDWTSAGCRVETATVWVDA